MKKNVTIVEFFYAVITGLIVSLIFWQTIDIRALTIIAIVLASGEVLLRLKWRLTLSCPYCGFDPILYKTDINKASQKIQRHFQRRRRDPNILLSKNTILEIPRPNKPKPPPQRLDVNL